MDRVEAAAVLSVLKAAFPHSFGGSGLEAMKVRDADAMVELWARMFADESYEEVSAAVSALIASRTAGYSPTVGEVKEQLQRFKAGEELSEHAAWALVSKACSNGLYHYREEFEKLPAEVQRAVGAPEQLKEWAAMDAETVQSVVASNFMRGFRAQTAREKEAAKLPAEIRRMIGGIAEGMKMLE